ncbi:MAG: translation initiation factor IF-2 [Candidatus Peribacteraceae bacterium]|nr:translation initiation factor IF-2 [Candidatus Peribacteraceae bacterium]
MRLVQVAKVLGMTGQQLRKELEQVDFGVKATDREIPDNLAIGVARFIARKHNLTVNLDSLMQPMSLEPDDEASATPAAAQPAETVAAAPVEQKVDALHVLRKLSLDDVSPAATARQAALTRPAPLPARGGFGSRRPPERGPRPSMPKRGTQQPTVQEQIKRKEGIVTLPAQLTVKEFAEKAGIQVPQVVGTLMKNGVMATITQTIDYDTAAIVAAELGVTVAREQSAAKVEDLVSRNLEALLKDDTEGLVPRPPIVVVMGHVDHGKTSLLDAIRQTDVAGGEAGGITQAIGAYQVVHDGKPITFLDTPGHGAFTAMRARGAQVTDVVILVVAADDGVKDTTIEAISHAKEAGVPIIVALTKIDKEASDPERVKGELAKHEILVEEWGGTIPLVACSAVTKQGIPQLLEQILLVTELEELKAKPDRRAVATVIESHLDSSLGALGTVIINTGTLRIGDIFVCGGTSGRVRAMTSSRGERVEEAPPSGAVRVSGFDTVAQVGDILQVVPSERDARELVDQYLTEAGKDKKQSFVDLVARLSEGRATQLKAVLKVDTQGSLEAIRGALEAISNEGVTVKVIHGAVGAVSENDVMMASASGGVVIAFHVTVPPAVARTAEREDVKIRQYDVIYALLEEIEQMLGGLLEPEETEAVLGHLEVRGVFMTKRSEQVVGGRVTDGLIKRLPFRLQRGGETVATGRITSLRKVDQDIKEAKEGTECGMRTECSTPIEEGDILEVFTREMKRKSAVV